MVLGICELIWIKTPQKELKVKIQEPMKLFYNNEIAINIAHNHFNMSEPSISKLIGTSLKRRLKL